MEVVVGLPSLGGLAIWQRRLFLTLTGCGDGAGVLFPGVGVDEDVLRNSRHPRTSSSS